MLRILTAGESPWPDPFAKANRTRARRRRTLDEHLGPVGDRGQHGDLLIDEMVHSDTTIRVQDARTQDELRVQSLRQR